MSPIRAAISATLFALLISNLLFASEPKPRSQASGDQLGTTLPEMARRDVGGGFWRIDGSFESVLRIKNVLETSEITVIPVLWMADGTEFDLAPLVLRKAGVAAIDIREALRNAPPQIASHISEFGSAGLRYTWRWRDAVTGIVTSIDPVDSLSYTTHLAATIAPNADLREVKEQPNLEEGLWWKHTPAVVPFLTLVNTNAKPVAVRIAFSDAQDRNSAAKEVTVLAGESQLLQLDDLVQQLPGAPQAGGVRISYAARAGTLVVEGGLQDFGAGYSANLPMLSLDARNVRTLVSGASTTFAAVGVQLGKPDPKMQFPVGTEFVPYAWLRNLTSAPLHVKLAVSYTGSKSEKMQLGSLILNAKESRQVDLPSLLAKAELANYSGGANFAFTTEGAGDNLLVATGSTSKNANYVFAVDPAILVPETGQIICNWQVEGKTDTMFSFWNSGSKAEDAELLLFFSGGHYRLAIHLEANESRAVDLGELIRGGIPDTDGNVLPTNATQGSARLTNPKGRRMVMDIKEHAGIFNVETATCLEPCPECDGIIFVTANPDPGVTTPGGTVPFQALATSKDGTIGDVTIFTSWSSSNAGIATIASNGVGTGVSVGSATISGNYRDTGVPRWKEGSLCQYPLPQCPVFVGNPTTPMNVFSAQITTADITQDRIVVVLSGPASVTGNLRLVVTGQNGSQPVQSINTGANPQGPGTYTYSFQQDTIPIGEYFTVTATWTPNGQTITANQNYHFKVLGTYVQTQYNTPAENQCSGSPQPITVWDNNCHGTDTTVISGFDFRVTNKQGGTGSGHSIQWGDVSQEFTCSVGSGDLREFVTITGTLGSLSDFTVAACSGNTDLYVTGAQVYIRGEGVKTVTDRCPACCLDGTHIDNYTSNTQCSGVSSLAPALTVRLY